MAEVIVALDTESGKEALRLVAALPQLRWAKVGPVLFVREGPRILRQLQDRGIRVFLDLKWYDIPTTVARAAAAAAEQGVALATVHAAGGRAMVAGAVAAAGSSLRIAAVTVLTSHSLASWAEAVGRAPDGWELADDVLRLTRLAADAGAGAVVVSSSEVARVRQVVPRETWLVVPGIRLAGQADDDQVRVGDPAAAVRAGATHLVVGRPVVGAEDPARVYSELCEAASCKQG